VLGVFGVLLVAARRSGDATPLLLAPEVWAAPAGTGGQAARGPSAPAPQHGAERAQPTVVAEAEATPQGVKLALRGGGWPARASLTIRVSAPPGTREALDLGTAVANAAGDFRATKLTRCSTSDPAGGRERLTVTVRTADGTVAAETTLAATPWVCPPA
jgi:hypothetical protein